MTFDEAVAKWEVAKSSGPLTRSMFVSPFKGVSDEEYNRRLYLDRTFSSIVEELRKEYAPTIEMTPDEYAAYEYYKDNTDNYAEPLAQWILSLYEDVTPDDYYGMYGEYDVDDQRDIIRFVHVWEHPELIKVVEK